MMLDFVGRDWMLKILKCDVAGISCKGSRSADFALFPSAVLGMLPAFQSAFGTQEALCWLRKNDKKDN